MYAFVAFVLVMIGCNGIEKVRKQRTNAQDGNYFYMKKRNAPYSSGNFMLTFRTFFSCIV